MRVYSHAHRVVYKRQFSLTVSLDTDKTQHVWKEK